MICLPVESVAQVDSLRMKLYVHPYQSAVIQIVISSDRASDIFRGSQTTSIYFVAARPHLSEHDERFAHVCALITSSIVRRRTSLVPRLGF